MKKLNLKLSMKESFMAGYNISAGLNTIKNSDVLFELDGIKVVKNDNIVHSVGSVMGCSGFLNTIEGVIDCIFVDDRYDIIPDYVKEFILYHEIGHIRNKHFKYDNQLNKKSDKYAFSRLFKLKREEIEADKYSMNKVGKENTIKVFNFLLNNTNLGFTTKRELKLRRNELLKL